MVEWGGRWEGGGGWWVGRVRLRAWHVGLLGHLSVPLPDRWHFPLPAQCSGPRHQSRGCLDRFPLVPLVARCQVLCLCLGWACLVWWFGVVFLFSALSWGEGVVSAGSLLLWSWSRVSRSLSMNFSSFEGARVVRQVKQVLGSGGLG